jgi:hypothetical protein
MLVTPYTFKREIKTYLSVFQLYSLIFSSPVFPVSVKVNSKSLLLIWADYNPLHLFNYSKTITTLKTGTGTGLNLTFNSIRCCDTALSSIIRLNIKKYDFRKWEMT